MRDPDPRLRDILWRLFVDGAWNPVTAADFDRALEDARPAIENMPCQDCGTTAWPVVAKPPRGSPDWWDDPNDYFACRRCGRFLGETPVVAHLVRLPTRDYPYKGFPPLHP